MKLAHSFAESSKQNGCYRPKSAGEGAASMARIIDPPRSKSDADLQHVVVDWELRVAEDDARHKESGHGRRSSHDKDDDGRKWPNPPSDDRTHVR